jgi:hypothetical protein
LIFNKLCDSVFFEQNFLLFLQNFLLENHKLVGSSPDAEPKIAGAFRGGPSFDFFFEIEGGGMQNGGDFWESPPF